MADDPNDDPELPRVLAVAWGIEVAPQRGPRRELTHERIVEAAIELADEQGLEAVTMQRVAASLGFTTMALYRYVGSKDELHALMMDAAVAQGGAIAADDADWRAGIRDWAEHLRGSYRAHPWILDLQPEPITLLMPSNLRVLDRALRILEPLGLDVSDAIDVVSAMTLQIRGFEGIARDFAAKPILLGPAALAALTEVVTPGKFPILAPLVASGWYTGGLDEAAAADGSGADPAPERSGGRALPESSAPPASHAGAESVATGDDVDPLGRSVGFDALLDGIAHLAEVTRERSGESPTESSTESGPTAGLPSRGVPSGMAGRRFAPADALEAAELRVAEAMASRAAAQAKMKDAQRRLREAERALEVAKVARSTAKAAAKAAAKG